MNEIILKILKALGNECPSKEQLKLATRLFCTVSTQQHLIFDRQLTQKEAGCLLLVAKGLKSNEIAQLLNLKTATIETHRRNILKKLACKNTNQAVFEGIRFGCIALE